MSSEGAWGRDRRHSRGRGAWGFVAVWAACVSIGAAAAQVGQGDGSPAPSAGPLETIVVSASRIGQRLADAPAAVTVLSSAALQQLPWDDYGDLLRTVPGLNVAQTGVRDINVTARGATSTLSTSQLLLLDGRSMYLDFFGFVMWDLLPVQPQEIDRIEVVRGPGSAVWGANAMTGVVNVITKRPKDMLGTTVVVGTPYANVVHAAARGKLGYRVSAGFFAQSAYERPTGEVPGSVPPQTYPNFENRDTRQRRVDARVDYDLTGDSFVSLSGGYADTAGILESGIGPFDIAKGSGLSYVKADWNGGSAHVGFYGNFLRGDAKNLLTLGATGRPLSFHFATDTYDLEMSESARAGDRNTLTYGADFRKSSFELGIAPAASGRKERGAFLQDELGLADRLSWVLGARYDRVDPLDKAVLTPRTSLLFSLSPSQVLRFSYSEAFRTPSVVNDDLDVTILQQLGPFLAPAAAEGDPGLGRERMQAYEVGYVGTLGGGMTATASAYENVIEDSIDFFVRRAYGPANLPQPSATLPAAVIPCFLFEPGTGPAACPLGGLAGVVPSAYSYRNVGKTVNRGLELSLQQSVSVWHWFANLSWQQAPRVSGAGVDPSGLNVPPEWRANFGVGHDAVRLFWDATVNYQSKAYWADVLYARGYTAAFTQVGAILGWRFPGDRLQIKGIAQNLLDARVQQHIFGDILSRRFEGEISYRF